MHMHMHDKCRPRITDSWYTISVYEFQTSLWNFGELINMGSSSCVSSQQVWVQPHLHVGLLIRGQSGHGWISFALSSCLVDISLQLQCQEYTYHTRTDVDRVTVIHALMDLTTTVLLPTLHQYSTCIIIWVATPLLKLQCTVMSTSEHNNKIKILIIDVSQFPTPSILLLTIANHHNLL